ncbi:MAG: DUF3386 family protein [Planctomycetaceae bacterium]
MRSILLAVIAVLFVCGEASDALAHFLFIRINAPAEAGRSVEVFFSELAEAGDPRFIDKIAPTRLTIQESPGKFEPLEVHRGADRLRAYLPAKGAVSVHGFLEYGVLKREVNFLLRYYPKAISGSPAEINALRPAPKEGLEIGVEVRGDEVALQLIQNGKPIPKAHFTTVDDDLNNREFDADESGLAIFKPGEAGHHCVYAKAVIPQGGEDNGTKYTEIREFATLAFHWPLVRDGGDAEAVKLFQDALSARASWTDFPGFTAEVAGAMDGRSFDGKVSVAADGTIHLEIDQDVAKPWVEEQLASIVMHRRASASNPKEKKEEPAPVLRFADRDERHPLGRLLTFVGGEMASSYRIKDDQILVVNRTFGGQNMTITVSENEKNPEGKFLSRDYTVQYWDAKTGKLDRTETIRNRWKRVGTIDLPAEITVSTASSAGLTVRSVTLSNVQTLPAK